MSLTKWLHLWHGKGIDYIKGKTKMAESKKEDGKKAVDEEVMEQTKVKKTKSKKGDNNVSEKESEEILNLQQQLEESRDKNLRLFAEFENFKKRNHKERFDLMKTAAQETINVILPVLDDFDRAKKAAEDKSTEEQLSEGILMVYNKLYAVLNNKGLTEMESTGQNFDPEIHEAITEIPAPSKDMKGKVVDTVEKGYYLNDKIIRFAKVVVGK